jgi:adenine-specific DNA-methyltransferase
MNHVPSTTEIGSAAEQLQFDARRLADFQRIEDSLSTDRRTFERPKPGHIVAQGDCLDVLKSIPNQSVGLILTDPPYHATKKSNITGDTDFESDLHYLDWIRQLAAEWRRVIRGNGSIYVFCSPRLCGRIEDALRGPFRIYPSITWTKPNEPGFDGWKQKMDKEALRIWYPHSERIVFGDVAEDGNLFRSPLANYLKILRKNCGLSTYDVTEIIGAYGRVNHGGAVSNWEAGRNTPSRDQYRKMSKAFLDTRRVDEVLPYDEVVRPFNADPSLPFTDVWDFPNIRPYKGKHPAEKPVELLTHIIRTSSNPGDIVLDCFGGSGSTAAAAVSTSRRSITIEVEPSWVDRSCERIRLYKQEAAARTTAHNSKKPAKSGDLFDPRD